jgi:hypothetical protein
MRAPYKGVLLRFPLEVKDRIDAAAKESGKSLNGEVVARLATSLNRETDAHRLGLALVGVMNAAGERAAEKAGVADWMTSPWPYAMACQAVAVVLARLAPPGPVTPPPVELSDEIVSQMGEETARLYTEATQMRLGATIADYLLSGGGSIYEQAQEFQATLPAKVAKQLKTKEKTT